MPDTVPVPLSKFGKDHWSMLAYVEHCCVDAGGRLDPRRVRCNENTHPLLAANHSSSGWQPTWGTKLAGYFDSPEKGNPEKAEAAGVFLTNHDDWDCLDDLAAAGYVEILSLANGLVRMTEAGQAVASTLRVFKAGGGHFAAFLAPVAPAAA